MSDSRASSVHRPSTVRSSGKHIALRSIRGRRAKLLPERSSKNWVLTQHLSGVLHSEEHLVESGCGKRVEGVGARCVTGLPKHRKCPSNGPSLTRRGGLSGRG
eukprot:6466881-Amphidinium_carterae.1